MLRAVLADPTCAQYIPLSLYELRHVVGSPAIYVLDCSGAGVLLPHFAAPLQAQSGEGEGACTRRRFRRSRPTAAPPSVEASSMSEQALGRVSLLCCATPQTKNTALIDFRGKWPRQRGSSKPSDGIR